MKVARAHAHVQDARRDFHHQLSTRIIPRKPSGVRGGPAGAVHDRDVNAAKNILALGRGERLNARGGRVRPAATLAQADEAKPQERRITRHRAESAPSGEGASQGRVWISTIGMVVGCLVPPAGSTVIASWSPGWKSAARTGEVGRALLAGSRPTERAPAGLITQSW